MTDRYARIRQALAHGGEGGMNERPIIMRDWEVRAILAGQKTMIRRVLRIPPRKLCPVSAQFSSVKNGVAMFICGTDGALVRCQLGQPGDRLWVRENFYQDGQWSLRLGCEPDDPRGRFWSGTSRVIFAADGTPLPDPIPGNQWRFRPSIHMPRLLSRITLEVTGVRVERLQDISGMDAKREGVSVPAHLPHDGADLDYARREYRRIWQSINGPGSWDANPWVWVVEFERMKENKA
jgi:hypothetical protein